VSEYQRGYIDRDFDAEPFASVVPAYSGRIYPRSQWRELLELQKKNKTSPLDHFLSGNCKVLDQKKTNYCWCAGVTGAVQVAYAIQGVDPAPHLSHTYPAALGKKFANRGGWGMEAVRYINEFGLPTVDHYPQGVISRSKTQGEAVKASAAKHSIVAFEEIESRNFDAAISALLCPISPSPVSCGFSWWGHLVFAAAAVYSNGQWGLEIVNSWSDKWKNNGRTQLFGSKAVAHEYIAVRAAEVTSDE